MVDPASVENLVQDSPLKIPPLESGDRLSRAEFERRYEAMPHLKKAELIEGVVYVPAALRFRSHSQPHGRVMAWLGIYLNEGEYVSLAADQDGVMRSRQC